MFNFLIKNKPLKVLISINVVFIFAANMFPSIFALFIKEIGGGALTAGSVWAVFSLTAGILMLVLTRFGDKIKEKEYLIAAGYFFRMIGWIGYFFAGAIWHLYLLQIVLALGEALGTPAFNAVYSEHLNKGRYIKQWGVWGSFNLTVMALAAFSGGAIVSFCGFKTLFLLMAGLSAFSLILLMIQPRKLL